MSYNGRTVTYDAIGNVTDDGLWEYVWTQGRQLAQMSQGATTWSYTYDAWGNVLTATDSDLANYNPLRYRGYVYDQETGLYYLQSRYYNPKIGRFINADAYIATGRKFIGNNMFAYALNSPVIYGDPDGEDAIILLSLGITGHLGVLVQDEDGKWWLSLTM